MSIKLVKTKTFKGQEHIERRQSMADRAKLEGHPHWFDGVPVTCYDLVLYMEELTKALPHIKFHPRTESTYCKRFYATLDDQPYALGSVGYGDISVHKNGTNKPYVTSRKIQNGKFASHRDQYHCVSPSNIDKAVKEARKYLVPYTNAEIIFYMYEQVRDQAVKHIDSSSSKAQDLCRRYSTGWGIKSEFMDEMRHLKALMTNNGFKFATSYFHDAMRDIDEAYAEWMEVRRYAPAMTFVRVENGEYPRVHVVKGVSNARQDLRFDLDKSVETSYSIDELPEDLAGKIAVLNILNDEQYAVRVGYKYDNNIFWIERDLNDDTL